MKKLTLLILLLIVYSLAFADSEYQSITPLSKTEGMSGERYRILGDFNCDGIEDMALSVDVSFFGNAGGDFDIYLRDNKSNLRKYASIFLHYRAIAIEKIGENVRLWVYRRCGGWIGDIGYYEVKAEGLSDYKSITIYPGDSGTGMGNAIYGAVLKNSAVEFRVEKSETVNGKVNWIKL